MKNPVVALGLLAVAGGLLLAPLGLGPWPPPLLWNLSASVAEGLYLRSGPAPTAGGLVAVCLPENLGRFARDRGYVSRGRCAGGEAPLLKRVAALAGQEVDYQDGSILIDGRPWPGTAIRQLDRQGRALPLARTFPYQLAPGEVFLLGEDPLSLDSRYLGALPEAAVLGVYRPLWIPGGPSP